MKDEELEVLRAEFVKTYASVPAKLREEIIALVDGKPFNWNSAYVEVVGKTNAGDEILKHLVSIRILKLSEKEGE